MDKKFKRLLYKLGFQISLKDPQFFFYQHRDAQDLLLYIYPTYQQAMFVFEGNYEHPLYEGSYNTEEFFPMLRQALDQILD